MTDTTQLDQQIASLQAERAAIAAMEATSAAFHDSEGNAFTDQSAIDSALLRSAGVAMEARLKTLSSTEEPWQHITDLQEKAVTALQAGQFVDAALYCAMLAAGHVFN